MFPLNIEIGIKTTIKPSYVFSLNTFQKTHSKQYHNGHSIDTVLRDFFNALHTFTILRRNVTYHTICSLYFMLYSSLQSYRAVQMKV